jgi:hypothetical protein
LFSREGAIGRKLLVQVKKDLNDVVKVCEGKLKQTNHLRTLMSSLTKGFCLIPDISRIRFSTMSLFPQAQYLIIGGGTK